MPGLRLADGAGQARRETDLGGSAASEAGLAIGTVAPGGHRVVETAIIATASQRPLAFLVRTRFNEGRA